MGMVNRSVLIFCSATNWCCRWAQSMCLLTASFFLKESEGRMRPLRTMILLMALVLTACYRPQTRVVDDVACPEGGGFVPGVGVVSCDLYGHDKFLLEQYDVAPGTENKRRCNGAVWFVECWDAQEQPVLQQTTAPDTQSKQRAR